MSLQLQPWSQNLPWFDNCSQEGEPDHTCSLCGNVIGTRDDDPRRDTHDEFCVGCEVCDIAVILFRGKGRDMKIQRYHTSCFSRVLTARPVLGPVELAR